jgi:predicted  nucleic acid-binding Zn-ribbon protein
MQPSALWRDRSGGAFLFSVADPPDKLRGMVPEIEAVVRLQSLDDRIGAAQKEIASLPKHVADIERKLDVHTRRLENDRTALAGNLKKRKSLEDDIKTHQTKISKLRDQMLQAKTNDQYRAFQNEIGWCETEIRKAEDQILDLMSEGEPLEANVKAAEGALGEEKKSVEAEKARARQRTAEDEEILGRLTGERASLAATIDPKILGQYERSRKRWHGTGIADATEGRCSACFIALRPQFFQELRKGDKVMTCESCGRILFYNPPVNLEHEMHQRSS